MTLIRWISASLLLAAVAVLPAGLSGAGAMAAPAPVKIGEVNSYSSMPAFTVPYRNGWQLAVQEINAAGGVLGGRPLEVISRDDMGRPGDAVTAATELVGQDKVVLLTGSFLSHVGLALSDFAKQKQVVFLAAEPLTDSLIWAQGNRYTFRLRPSSFMQAGLLAREAAKLPATRWATVAPNYEYGQTMVSNFKQALAALRPDVTFVSEQWPPLGKLDAGPTVQALERAKPDGIFNAAFAGDLARLVREGQTRGVFTGRAVVSVLTGEPEYLDVLGAEAPVGWTVTGYPWYDLDTPAHRAFVEAYRQRYHEDPRMGSLVGYLTLKAVAAALDRAQSTDSSKLIAAFEGLRFDSPAGEISFRAADHQATMAAWVGTTALRDGRGVMVNWRQADGADLLPDEETARKLRPAE